MKNLLLSKGLPSPCGKSRNELTEVLLREEYGFLPEAARVSGEILSVQNNFCAGKANLEKINICCEGSFGSFSFPVSFSYSPNKKTPCFVHINFRADIPDRYQPTEELIDSGYAIISFCYNDVTMDNNDFRNGLAGVVYPDGSKGDRDCGKIGLWAWAAMRVIDYLCTRPEIDTSRICVVGHSRLGKTALLTGALDERIYCAFSNNSGCSGAALSRNNKGETIEKICGSFDYWFCDAYKDYANRESELPFDQHWLLAANSHHKVYVASAEEDLWADPDNEYLSCVGASEYFEAEGKKGFVHPDRLPIAGDCFHEGNIGYHLRSGKHYLSREDWQLYIRFLERQ